MSAALLDYSANVVLDGSGYGEVRIAPTTEPWEIRNTSVVVSDRTSEARLRVYVGQIGDIYQMDVTYSGSSGDSSDTVYNLNEGEAIYFVWDGGTPGATASVRIRGVRSQINRGFRTS